MAEKLTAKQEAFIKEYVVDLNGKQAAIRCGYSPKTAEQQASRLLSNVKVRQAIDEKLLRLSRKTEITAEYVLNGIKAIADSAEKENDKLKAFELLGKHLKLFTDKIEHSGETGVRIINDIPRSKSN